ncbi:hypothetical protein [Capybara microvirus Cap3_SP_468]|nr:hypothetical protein [Capybara microvirus Cap3_SP_468]
MNKLFKPDEVGSYPVNVQSDFDQYYFENEVVKKFVKTGVDNEGDDVGYIQEKVIVHKRLIKDVVAQDADSVGVEPYLKMMALSGQSLPDVSFTDEINDFTQFPEDVGDAMRLGDKANALYASLPEEIRRNYTLDQFMQSDYEKIVSDYLALKKAEIEAAQKGGSENV